MEKKTIREEFPLGTDVSHFEIPLTAQERFWIQVLASRVWDEGPYIEDVVRGLELAMKRGKQIGMGAEK